MGPGAESLIVGPGARKGSSGPKMGRGGHLNLLKTKNGSFMAQELGVNGGLQCCPMP